MKKNFSIATIADQLEIEESEVHAILNIVEKSAPDYEEEAIVKELLQKTK